MTERVPTALCRILFTIIQSATGISNSSMQTYFKVLTHSNVSCETVNLEYARKTLHRETKISSELNS